MIMTLSEQVDRLVSENQHLRVKTENDEITRHLMKQQYDTLAGSVDAMRSAHDREIHALRTERDQAVRAFKEIDSLLLQTADMVMQALRARQGDETPERIPDRHVLHMDDPRLPLARLS